MMRNKDDFGSPIDKDGLKIAEDFMVEELGVSRPSIWAASLTQKIGSNVYSLPDVMCRFVDFLHRKKGMERVDFKDMRMNENGDMELDCEWGQLAFKIQFDSEEKAIRVKKMKNLGKLNVTVVVEGENTVLIL